MHIFIASHGQLASGMLSSLEVLLGKQKNIQTFDAYLGEKRLKDQLDEFLSKVEKEETVVLLSDLYGGSVNQEMYTYLTREHTFLVAGVNLAFVLELAMYQGIVDEELLDSIVSNGQQMMKRVPLEMEEVVEEGFF